MWRVHTCVREVGVCGAETGVQTVHDNWTGFIDLHGELRHDIVYLRSFVIKRIILKQNGSDDGCCILVARTCGAEAHSNILSAMSLGSVHEEKSASAMFLYARASEYMYGNLGIVLGGSYCSHAHMLHAVVDRPIMCDAY